MDVCGVGRPTHWSYAPTCTIAEPAAIQGLFKNVRVFKCIRNLSEYECFFDFYQAWNVP